jgi:outer membrane immunogenic protein
MSAFLRAAAIVIACGTKASAADLAQPYTAVAAPAFSWSGIYLGVHGGYGWSSPQGLALSGDLAGGELGVNYQVGNFVIGLEGDGDWADISHAITSGTVTDDALASLRGRFGYAFNNVLIYGTAGGGWGHESFSGAVSSSAWQTGWSAGGGVEWAFFPKWTARLEYLHYGLGNAANIGVPNSGSFDVDIVRAGISYLFH